MASDSLQVPTRDDVQAAAQRIKPYVARTPVLRSDALDRLAGASLFCKAECLQITGSFKIRGATNRLVRVKQELGDKDIVAFSSGNHAQGVARAARWLDLKATIVMPKTAPSVKIDGVKADGAVIRLYDPEMESREEIGAQIAKDTGAVLVPSFDDPYIVAGQGTVGLELLEQVSALNGQLDALICCTGGGGLVSGISLAFGDAETEIWTAEPNGHDDWARSLSEGQTIRNEPGVRSICDAILTPTPGDIPWHIGRDRFAGGDTVSDDQVMAAMKLAFRHLKVVLEPGGAVALAAALFSSKRKRTGQRIGVILSGGNVDPDMFVRALGVNDP
ncbi:MAG: threonine/serine dehydratase [Pseudomonadota bacterium]